MRTQPPSSSFLNLIKRRKGRAEIQQSIMEEYRGFSEEMVEFTSTQWIQPIYKWRGRSQTISNSNFNPLKSQFTSWDLWSTEEAHYQSLQPRDISHYGARIWRGAGYKFQENKL